MVLEEQKKEKMNLTKIISFCSTCGVILTVIQGAASLIQQLKGNSNEQQHG